MSDSPASSGRYIRMALVGFPLGLIITSILSFGIWWQKKVAVEERSLAHASALRREMTLPVLDRYTSILREVMQPQGWERVAAVASFVDSSMSPENMGYEPRRDRFYQDGLEVSNVEVELTGKHRPREIRLVLVPYGDLARTEAEVQALAGLMALGHSLAGARDETTLRLAVVPLGVKDASGRTALERLGGAAQERQERLMKIIVLGGVGEEVLGQVRQAFRTAQTGAVVEALPASRSIAETLEAMRALKARL